MSEIEHKQLKGLQIGNNIYSQIDDTVDNDPQLTWSGQKITQRAYLKEKQEGDSITVMSSYSGTVTILNKNSNFLKIYANTRYNYTPGYTMRTTGAPSLNSGSSWVTQPTNDYIDVPSLKNNEGSEIYLYMEQWPAQTDSNTNGATVFYNSDKTKLDGGVFQAPQDSDNNTVKIPEGSSLFRFTYSRALYAPENADADATAAPYIQFYIKEIPEESYITITGLMKLTPYTIEVGDEGVILYNTDPIGEHFTQIENQIGEGFSETNTVKNQIDQINDTIGSKSSTDFDNKTLWQVLEELNSRITTLENYHPVEET